MLLLAHGYRPESAPLVADLETDLAAYRPLLDAGWIVAKTSYRRNGIVVADAIRDLDNLRAHLASRHGEPTQVIVSGDSMGGTIVTLMSERGGSDYAGFVAIGAALDLREPDGAGGVTLQPRLPLLFVANRSEFSGPRDYVAAVPRHLLELVVPALFRIDRDGHVNVNQAERLHAVQALTTWLARGRGALPEPAAGQRYYDATRTPEPGPSQVTLDADRRGFTATVVEVSAIYGNVWLNVQPADLAAIGWTTGLWAELQVGDQTFRVRHGTDFDSVERGQWVLFPNADGFCWLSRNWANAVETASLRVGDSVRFRRYPAEN